VGLSSTEYREVEPRLILSKIPDVVKGSVCVFSAHGTWGVYPDNKLDESKLDKYLYYIPLLIDYNMNNIGVRDIIYFESKNKILMIYKIDKKKKCLWSMDGKMWSYKKEKIYRIIEFMIDGSKDTNDFIRDDIYAELKKYLH
jgi:hypothetical protein